MPITIDGDNLLITLPSATSEIDVNADLYSEWKTWSLLNDNLRYEQAFREDGGGPLTPGINQGGYIFIQNQHGWRIKPAEEDATVFITGNLAPEDSSLPILVRTIGAFRVGIFGLQPITQNVSQVLTQLQESQYQGVVHIDTFAGTAGTLFPIGTASEPVLTLVDGLIIASNIGVREIHFIGVLTLPVDLPFWSFLGTAAVAEIDINGQDVSGTVFNGAGISGNFPVLTQRVVINKGRVSPAGITNYVGVIAQSVLGGNISLQAGKTSLVDVSSDISGPTKPILDCQGNNVDVGVRGYIGGLEVRNFSHASGIMSIDSHSADVLIDATCTDGIIVIRGVSGLTDNSGPGCIVIDKDLLRPLTVNLAGAVHINSISGDDTNAGTHGNPVKTAAAARVIADCHGVTEYHIVGSVTLTTPHDRWSFLGDSASFNDIVNLGNQSVDESRFEGIQISGDAAESNIEALRCGIDNPGNLHGVFRQCGLINTFKIEASTPQTYIFHHCYSQVAGPGRPVIDFTNVAVTHNVQFRNYIGGMDVQNMVQGNLSIDGPAMRLGLLPTIMGGDIVVGGTGVMADASGGTTTVIPDSFIQAIKIDELHALDGLDASRPLTLTPTSRDAGAIHQDVTGDGANISTVTRN